MWGEEMWVKPICKNNANEFVVKISIFNLALYMSSLSGDILGGYPRASNPFRLLM